MEQHPVPQNVTTFQFRLIGDMTLKQFGYLAGGAIGAIIFYNLPLPFFFTWPFTILSAFFGIGFAFIPIEERPMDVWVLSFLKNVYSPTMYVWQRSPPAVEPAMAALPSVIALPAKQQTTHNSVPVATTSSTTTAIAQPPPPQHTAPPATQQAHAAPASEHEAKRANMFSWIDNLFVAPAKHTAAVSPVVLPKPQPVQQIHPQYIPVSPPQQTVQPTDGNPIYSAPTPSITGIKPDVQVTLPGRQVGVSTQVGIPTQKQTEDPRISELQKQLEALKNELTKKTEVESRFVELQKQTVDVLRQKQDLENRLVAINKKAAQTPVSPQPQATYKTPGVLSQRGPTVKVFTPEAAIRAGLPRLTTFPNVVTGILKDYDGGLLPGVLVTVRDPDGVPVRALKTNKLGQFAASTPLPNGVYLIEVEDPRGRFQFDRVQFTLNGSILPAIEVVAKSKRDLDRADLERKIFSQPNT